MTFVGKFEKKKIRNCGRKRRGGRRGDNEKERKKTYSVFAYPEKNDLLWFHPEGFFLKKRSFSLFWFIWSTKKKGKLTIRFFLKKDFFSEEKKTKGIIKKMEKKINLFPFL